MRSFDVVAKEYNLEQYWSSLRTDDDLEVTAQIPSQTGGITFFSPGNLEGNRNICSGSSGSILLNSNVGFADTIEFTDFALSWIMYPSVSDLWLVRFNHELDSLMDEFVDPFEDWYAYSLGDDHTENYEEDYGGDSLAIGVRISGNGVLSLIWPNKDGEIVEERLLYNEEASYFALTRVGDSVSVVLNSEIITIEDAFTGPLDGLMFGGGGGNTLIDKVAFSTTGKLPDIDEYFSLFKLTRLDTVPRPDAACSFQYISDISSPRYEMIVPDDFFAENGYRYATLQNRTDTGIWSLDKRSSFDIQYSVDRGVTWDLLPTKLALTEPHESIIFRHSEESDVDHYIEVVTTDLIDLSLSSFDIEVDGVLHLPAIIGDGYYDAARADMTHASIEITPQEDDIIHSIEFLGAVGGQGTWIDETDAKVYINGQLRDSLSELREDQLYHVVLVYNSPQESVVINENKDVRLSISGLGAATVQYTDQEVYWIFNVFAGNTVINLSEELQQLVDAEAPNSEDSKAISATEVQWNR